MLFWSPGGRLSLLPVLALLCGIGIAHADAVYRAATATAGKPLQLGVYGTLSPTCAVGQPPEIKMTKPPSHGTIVVRSGTLKTGSKNRCPGLQVPIQLVVYQSSPGYVGLDEVSYDVRSPEGNVETQGIRINVAPADAAPRSPAAERPLRL